jgi:syntaxin 16
VGLPPSWVDDSEEIATNIQRAKVKMSELTKAHAKALMPSFGDGKDDQHQIETLTREITALLRKSEVRLKKLNCRKLIYNHIRWTIFCSTLLFLSVEAD